MHFLCSVSSAHKAEQPFHIGPGLDVDQVHAVAAGAVRCKLMLCQQRFKVPCQIGAGGKKFQIIFFLRINDRSTAQKSCANVRTDAGLAADKAGIDLQAGLAARGAEQLVHPGHLLRRADVEFIQHAAGSLLVQDLALHAAACEQLLGSLHRLLLLGLHHQTLCIKIFGKARNAISCRTHTAILLDAALRDLLPRAGCKTTHTSSNSVSVWHRGAARPARSRVACNTPRSYAQM